LESCDGFVVSSPAYNASYAGRPKNAIVLTGPDAEAVADLVAGVTPQWSTAMSGHARRGRSVLLGEV
jgi:NAD(P)H-dependent FMN reductase